jgi:hypothetical protein
MEGHAGEEEEEEEEEGGLTWRWRASRLVAKNDLPMHAFWQ